MEMRVVREAGHPVVWACDPMHANTFTSESGRKTRDFDHIVNEIGGFVVDTITRNLPIVCCPPKRCTIWIVKSVPFAFVVEGKN